MQAAIAELVSFGLENVTDRAFSNGVVVPNPDEYFYWDDNHFTAAFYKMMGQRAAMILHKLVTNYELQWTSRRALFGTSLRDNTYTLSREPLLGLVR